jgi:YHS domain-containing protein
MTTRAKMWFLLPALALSLGLAAVCVSTPAAVASPAALEMVPPVEAPMAFDTAPPVGTKARCPVSKNELTVAEGTPRSEYKGKHYVFCCPGCKPGFDADPEKYLDAK